MTIVLFNARCIDPDTDADFKGGVVIDGGYIQQVFQGEPPDHLLKGVETIDCEGHVLSPSLCDIFVGTKKSGGRNHDYFSKLSQAAAASGVGMLLMDADSGMVIDSVENLDYARRCALTGSDVKVSFSGSLTPDMQGNTMSDMGLLYNAGIRCFTNGDYALKDPVLLHRLLTYGTMLSNSVVALYPDIDDMSKMGDAHEGEVSTLYGLRPIPEVAEHVGLWRDITMAHALNVPLHVRAISSAHSVDIIRYGKDRGMNITVSISAQHLFLNEYDMIPYKTFMKMRPPLRTEEDRLALQNAVSEGLVDMITSQHRPCHSALKRLTYSEASEGCSAIETLLSVTLSLYLNGHVSLVHALKMVTIVPRRRFALEGGVLKEGAPADLIIFDPNASYQVSREAMISSESNTPYEGRMLQGKVLKHFVSGKNILKDT